MAGVKKQKELYDVIHACIADEIAEILKLRGVVSEEQLIQIRKKNEELFPLEK